MKILTRTPTPGDDQRGLPDTGGYNIPNGTITWLSVIYLVVNIASGSLTTLVSSTPQRNLDNKNIGLKEKNFQLQVLQRILEIENTEDRKVSLQLLLNVGLLLDEKGLSLFIDTISHIPQWPKRDLERLNTYQNSQINSYSPSNSPPFVYPAPANSGSTPRGNIQTSE